MDHPLSAPPSSPASPRSPVEERPRAPLVGIIGGVLLLAGFAAWSGIRISAATRAKKEVAAQRNEDAHRAATAAQALPSVAVVTPSPGNWEPVVEIDGTIVAGQAAELAFKTTGRLSQVSVKVGDTVKPGQLLASLDANEASAQLRAAKARVRAAEAQLALATDTEKRTAAMVQSGSTPEALGVQSSQQRALALAQLDSASAEVSLVGVSLSNHRLTAPFAGSITRAPDGVGAVVGPSATLFEVVDLSHLRLRGSLSEHDAPLVETGAALSIATEHGSTPGTVTAVLGSVDPATRRIRIEASVDNANGRLRAGSFVRAELRGKKSIPVLRLPHAVLRSNGQDEVFVVTGDVLASRRIDYSIDRNGDVLVRHGLAPEERVVLAPKPDAKAGDRVIIAAAPTPAPAPATPAPAASAR
jgi:RND family efflux transporter MFP subunit